MRRSRVTTTTLSTTTDATGRALRDICKQVLQLETYHKDFDRRGSSIPARRDSVVAKDLDIDLDS